MMSDEGHIALIYLSMTVSDYMDKCSLVYFAVNNKQGFAESPFNIFSALIDQVSERTENSLFLVNHFEYRKRLLKLYDKVSVFHSIPFLLGMNGIIG